MPKVKLAPGQLCGVAKAPCKSCPYRQDVPSGVWAAHEYEALRRYDGEFIDQIVQGGLSLFLCHQQDGNLCAGWLATHGPENLLALHLHAKEITPEVWSYTTTVPVFASGAEAAEHGMAEIEEPGVRARRTVKRLLSDPRRSAGAGADKDEAF